MGPSGRVGAGEQDSDVDRAAAAHENGGILETPTAGWYPDPADATGLRWWDGLGWTEYAKPGAPAAPAIPVPPLVPEYPSTPASSAIAPNYAATPSHAAAPNYPATTPNYAAMPSYGSPHAAAGPPAKLSRAEADRAVRRNNGFGYAGLVLALIGMIFNPLAVPSILAIIFGGMGLARARSLEGQGTRKQTGLGFSIAALILGILGVMRLLTSVLAATMGYGT